jgi:hypothetical protein
VADKQMTSSQERRWLARARTLERKAIDLFAEMEEALGEDADVLQYPSGAMTSCVELVTMLGGRSGG